jgi:hypothetical protein
MCPGAQSGAGCEQYRYANGVEARAEAFLAINHGVVGLLYFLAGSGGVTAANTTALILIDEAPELWSELQRIAYDVKQLAPAILGRPPAFADTVAVTGCGMHSPVNGGGAHDGGGRYCEWTTVDISVHLGRGGDLLIIAVNVAPTNVSSVMFDLSALTETILNRNGCVRILQ